MTSPPTPKRPPKTHRPLELALYLTADEDDRGITLTFDIPYQTSGISAAKPKRRVPLHRKPLSLTLSLTVPTPGLNSSRLTWDNDKSHRAKVDSPKLSPLPQIGPDSPSRGRRKRARTDDGLLDSAD